MFEFVDSVAKKYPSVDANVYTNLIPVFTAIFSYFIINEELTIQKIIGIVLVVGGLVLSQLKDFREKRRDKRNVF